MAHTLPRFASFLGECRPDVPNGETLQSRRRRRRSRMLSRTRFGIYAMTKDVKPSAYLAYLGYLNYGYHHHRKHLAAHTLGGFCLHAATVQWVITLMTEHACGHVPQALGLLPVTNWPVSLESDYDAIKRFRNLAWKVVSVGIVPEVLAKALGRSAHVFVSTPWPPGWLW